MRLTALVTGARYAWLTDDSGIGDSHAEPSVVCYKVTRLDSLLVRILQGELLGRRIEADEGVIREVGSQVKGVCIVDVDPPVETPDETPDESMTDETMGEEAGVPKRDSYSGAAALRMMKNVGSILLISHAFISR